MKLWPLAVAIALVGIGVDIARALVTHDHVGPLEYAVGVALLAVLGVHALTLARNGLRRA